MRIIKYAALAAALVIPGFPAAGLESVGRDYHFKISDAQTAAPPELVEDTVFFTFKPDYKVRFAGIAFLHDNYQVRPMESNSHGVLVYVLPIPAGLALLDYRLVVDGLWQPDPVNPQRVRDSAGVLLSRVRLPQSAVKPVKSPLVDEAERMVTFTWLGRPGERVFLAGSFNNWDPFSHRMIESEELGANGRLYNLTLQLLPGSYYYYFLVDGRKELDPANTGRAVDADRTAYSAFKLP